LVKDTRNQKSDQKSIKEFKIKDKRKIKNSDRRLKQEIKSSEKSGTRTEKKQGLIETSFSRTTDKEKGEAKTLVNTLGRLLKHEDLEDSTEYRRYKKYSGVANNLAAKGIIAPFEHITVPPIDTAINGGIVTIQYTTTMTADETGNLTIAFGQSMAHVSSSASAGTITGLYGSVFPYESNTYGGVDPLRWLVRSNSPDGASSGIYPNDANVMGSYPEMVIPAATVTTLLEDMQAFGMQFRYLGSGMRLIPAGPQGTRKGVLFASTCGRGGWDNVEDRASAFITQTKLTNMPNYIQGPVATQTIYSTLWPKQLVDMDYKASNYMMHADEELDKQQDFGSSVIGVKGGEPHDIYVFRFIIHYQLEPARAMFQLLEPIAVRCNPTVLAKIYDEYKTHCENHMVDNESEFDTYAPALHEPFHGSFHSVKEVSSPVKCPRMLYEQDGNCYHSKTEFHPITMSKHVGFLSVEKASPSALTGSAKNVINSVVGGMKTAYQVAKPLIDVAEILAGLF
jgi:hypothetical protein